MATPSLLLNSSKLTINCSIDNSSQIQKLGVIKTQILSYESNLKSKYQNQINYAQEKISNLQNQNNKCINLHSQLQSDKFNEDEKIKQQFANIQFLKRQCVEIKKSIEKLNKKMIEREESRKNESQRLNFLKQQILKERRLMVDLRNKQKEIIKQLKDQSQKQEKSKENENTKYSKLQQTSNQKQIGASNNLDLKNKQSTSLDKFRKEKTSISKKFFIESNKIQTIKHQFKSLNMEVQKQMKKRQRKNKCLKQKIHRTSKINSYSIASFENKAIKNTLNRCNSINEKTNEIIWKNNLKDSSIFSIKRNSLNNDKARSSSTNIESNENHKKLKFRSISKDKNLFKINFFTQPNDSDHMVPLMATISTMMKFCKIEQFRKEINQIPPFQLLELIIERNKVNEVLQMMEMDKVYMVQSYEKVKIKI